MGFTTWVRTWWVCPLPFRSTTVVDSHKVGAMWCTIASAYMGRDLTQPKDRWYAFLGIVNTFAYVLGYPTVVGLREFRLLEDICSWHLSAQPRLPTDLRIPSWSWLAARGAVYFFIPLHFSFQEAHARLLSSPPSFTDT